MKKRLQIIAATLLLAGPLVVSPLAIAESTTSGTSSSPSATTENENEAEKETETPEQEIKRLTEAEDKKDTKEQRIKSRVAEFKIKLTVAEIAKLKTKCVGAQAVLKTVETRVDNGVTARSNAYDELLSHLDSIIKKLKAANVSTTQLEEERTVLKNKIDAFKADLAKYKVALADTRAMGCAADPSAFKASLEATRAARKKVADDAAAIRSYVTGTIKPTLKALHDELDATKSTDTEGAN